MTTMPGREHKPNALGIFKGQDSGGTYTKQCIEFADELGYAHAYVCSHWGQLALALEMECRYPRPLAEGVAWLCIQDALHGIKVMGDCN